MSNLVDVKTDEHASASCGETSSTGWPHKVDVIGVKVSPVDYQQVIEAITEAALRDAPGLVSCHSVHALVTMSCDESLRQMANQFDLITPDGQPVRWATNLLHRTKLKDRVYGPELMLRLCQRAAAERFPIYLYGGDPTISPQLVQALREKFPNLIIAGAEAPPFRPLTPEEDEQVIKRINLSGAKLVFIGLGCPKQDLFAFEHRDSLKGIQICVGAAFDFHAGAKPMAPKWMQDRGLEWLFRLGSEPGRLWKRYLITNSVFVWKVARAMLKK